MRILKFILLIVASLALYSCGSTYFYAQLEAADPYTENSEVYNDFVYNTDSLEITYSFNGENAPVKIGIFNKMKRKVYVDWRHSFLQIGDNEENRISYAEYMEKWDGMALILPYERKWRQLLEMSGFGFDRIQDHYFKKEKMELPEEKPKDIKVLTFTEENTPVFMRSMLTLYIEEPHTTPFRYEQEFYISKLIKTTKIKPEDFPAVADKQGNCFYTVKQNGKAVKNILNVTGTVFLFAGYVAVEVATSNVEY